MLKYPVTTITLFGQVCSYEREYPVDLIKMKKLQSVLLKNSKQKQSGIFSSASTS